MFESVFSATCANFQDFISCFASCWLQVTAHTVSAFASRTTQNSQLVFFFVIWRQQFLLQLKYYLNEIIQIRNLPGELPTPWVAFFGCFTYLKTILFSFLFILLLDHSCRFNPVDCIGSISPDLRWSRVWNQPLFTHTACCEHLLHITSS